MPERVGMSTSVNKDKLDYDKIARLEIELGIVDPPSRVAVDEILKEIWPDVWPNQDNNVKRITIKNDWGGAIDTCPECAGEVCLAGYCPRCGWNAEVQ